MRYFLGKMAATLMTLLIVSVCLFLCFRLIPGDPATNMLGTAATPERVEALRNELGLNDPLPAQYLRWLSGAFRGDFGTSYVYKIPVSELISAKIPVTFSLAMISFGLMCVLSIPLGLYTARHAGGIIDRIVMVAGQVIMAVPPFFSGIMISWVFGMLLKWFRPGGYVSYAASPKAFFAYLIYPAIAIALPRAAMTIRLLRGTVMEEAGKDYVRTAYSRGNSTSSVMYRHVLKNAMMPVVTFLGMSLAHMLAGSLIIERVFSLPGVSQILLSSIGNRDYPVVEAIVMWIALIIIVVNFAVDLIYRVLDPKGV